MTIKCKIFKNLKTQGANWRIYSLTPADYIKIAAEWTCISALFAYIFYESLTAFFIIIAFGGLYVRYRKNLIIIKRKKEMSMQFREMCISVSDSMAAGASITNAIVSASGDMRRMYGDTAMICRELDVIIKGINISIPVETLFEKFAARTGIHDIGTFSEVLTIAQHSGGNMIKIMKNTADNIGEKVGVEREIDTIISSKKYEQSVMNAIPFVIIVYMKFSSPETFSIMYGTVTGTIIMTICLAIYAAAFAAGKKLTEIEV